MATPRDGSEPQGGRRHAFLLRLPPELHAELQRWAAEELRSLNGHLEFLLREAVRRRGRTSGPPASAPAPAPEREDSSSSERPSGD